MGNGSSVSLVLSLCPHVGFRRRGRLPHKDDPLPSRPFFFSSLCKVSLLVILLYFVPLHYLSVLVRTIYTPGSFRVLSETGKKKERWGTEVGCKIPQRVLVRIGVFSSQMEELEWYTVCRGNLVGTRIPTSVFVVPTRNLLSGLLL